MISASRCGGLNHVAVAIPTLKCAHRHVRFRPKRKYLLDQALPGLTQIGLQRDEISQREPLTLSTNPLCCDGLLGWGSRCSSIGDKR